MDETVEIVFVYNQLVQVKGIWYCKCTSVRSANAAPANWVLLTVRRHFFRIYFKRMPVQIIEQK